MKGEFDDILGDDIPAEYNKKHINRRLIEMYERVVEKDLAEKQEIWKKGVNKRKRDKKTLNTSNYLI